MAASILPMPGDAATETGALNAPVEKVASAPAADPAAIDLMEAEEVVTITDLVLQDKITRKNGSMIEKGVTEAPRRIKKLIAIYAGGPAPKTARDIPADKRAAFLLELDKAETVVLPSPWRWGSSLREKWSAGSERQSEHRGPDPWERSAYAGA